MIKWDSVIECGIFSIGFSKAAVWQYLFFIVGDESEVKSNCKTIGSCFLHQNIVIPIRWTKDRQAELEKYWLGGVRIYDWNDRLGMFGKYEVNEERLAGKIPLSPWPELQAELTWNNSGRDG